MIKTNYGGTDLWLLNDAPDWTAPLAADISVLRQTESSLTNRESRRPFSATLRFHTKFRVTAAEADARALAAGLKALTTEPVAVPLWPATVPWGSRGGRPLGAGLNIVFKDDWSQWQIYEGVEPAWPAATDWVAPLLWGILQDRKTNWEGPDLVNLTVDHVETSKAAWAVAPAAQMFANGPVTPGGQVPRVFPYEINFESPAHGFTLTILRQPIGFRRDVQQTCYPQVVAREQELGQFFGSLADTAGFLEFFRQHGGGKAFWCSSWLSAVVLTAPVGAADTVLQVEDTAGVSAGDWLVLSGPNANAFVQVQAIGARTVTLTAPVGTAFVQDTLVSHLVMGSFRQPKVTLQWHSWDDAEVLLPVREVPAELNPAADETLGVTLGLLAPRCYLYEFSRSLGGVVVVDRFTSYEGDLTYGANNYASQRLTHGQIAQSLFLDRDEVKVSADIWAGSPLMTFAMLGMEAPLLITIREGEVGAGGAALNVTQIFMGEVVDAQVKGATIEATVVPGGTLFDRKVPRFLLQLGCNHALFSPGCGLAQADWKFSAAMNVLAAGGYPFAYQIKTLAGVGAKAAAALAAGAVFQNWFAGGWIEFGAGATWQARAILASDHSLPGLVTLTLDRDANPRPAINDAVVLYPGCDGVYTTCQAFDAAGNPTGKFNNYLNFGGHPFLPVANPSLVAPAPNTGGGKK